MINYQEQTQSYSITPTIPRQWSITIFSLDNISHYNQYNNNTAKQQALQKFVAGPVICNRSQFRTSTRGEYEIESCCGHNNCPLVGQKHQSDGFSPDNQCQTQLSCLCLPVFWHELPCWILQSYRRLDQQLVSFLVSPRPFLENYQLGFDGDIFSSPSYFESLAFLEWSFRKDKFRHKSLNSNQYCKNNPETQ